MGHSGALVRPGLAWAALRRCTSYLGDWDRSPVLAAALERRNPELGRVEVDIARTKGERFAHPGSGERERAGQRLHRKVTLLLGK